MNSPAMDSLTALRRVETRASAIWRAPPDLSISQWADQYRRLSGEASAEKGNWQTATAEYQRGIMDAVGDPTIKEVWVMKSAQVGWTEIIGNVIGYYMSQDPSPMMLVQPSLEMAETWSQDRFAPMIRDTPLLRGLVANPRSRNSGNTLLRKAFPGGQITMAGANTPTSLAGRPLRIVMCDDVDRFPPRAGTEGDPINLAKKRTTAFWNRKFMAGSTPTMKGGSRVEIGFGGSDQRRYFVPCPHCHEFQVLVWSRVKWPEGEPERAFYVCAHCDAVIEDADRPAMVRAGEWRATAPFKGIAGFHIWEAYSPWRTLAEIVTDFLAAKDHPELLKVWVNTSLGESWEDRQGETLDKSSFRREEWNADEIPAEVVCCTAGVDVQDDRLEASIVGWCEGQRARVVAHHILYGSPGQAEVWASLDRLLGESYPTADGRRARVLGTCVDSGGHHTQAVYRYTTGRSAVYAIKGMAGAKPAWPAKVSKSTTHKHGRVWVIGVDTIKDWLRGALAVKNPELPHHVAFAADLDDDYFAQLLVEKRVVKYSTAGVGTRTWTKPKGARNEAWDALVYAFAALEALKVMRRLKLVAPRKPEVNEEAKPATRRIGRIGGMGR